MIRLTKGPMPDVLVRMSAIWTQVLLDRAARGEAFTDAEKSRYRHAEVKAALISETHGKCAYCESKIRHITHGDIDHIIPKSKAPEQTFTWHNLTLACDLCNERKSDHFGNHDDLVDPYVVEPEDHFFFLGPLILPVPGSDPGRLTETVLQLNRIELVERRQAKIRYLAAQVEVLARIRDAALRSVLRKDLTEKEILGSEEFAGLARHCLSELLDVLDKAERRRAASDAQKNTSVQIDPLAVRLDLLRSKFARPHQV